MGEAVGWIGVVISLIAILDNRLKQWMESKERQEKMKIDADKEAALSVVAVEAAALKTTVQLQGERLERQAADIKECKEDRSATKVELAKCEEKHVTNESRIAALESKNGVK